MTDYRYNSYLNSPDNSSQSLISTPRIDHFGRQDPMEEEQPLSISHWDQLGLGSTPMEPSLDIDNVFKDRAKGCIVGAILGDVIGSPLEGNPTNDPKEIEKALQSLSGGGLYNLDACQPTDLTEMTLCMLDGILKGKGVLNLDLLVQSYANWIWNVKKPFVTGMTIYEALRPAQGKMGLVTAQEIRDHSKTIEPPSLGCGTLMRITPLAVWCSKLNKEDIKHVIQEEAMLTHKAAIVQHVSIAYALIVHHLLNFPRDDAKDAYNECKRVLRDFNSTEVLEWIEKMEMTDGQKPVANRGNNHVKLPLCQGLYCLKQNKSFLEAMKFVLEQGGKTATNCSIVGGLVGAFVGFKNLPKDLTTKVMNFESDTRPAFVLPGKCLEKGLKELLTMIPTEKLILNAQFSAFTLVEDVSAPKKKRKVFNGNHRFKEEVRNKGRKINSDMMKRVREGNVIHINQERQFEKNELVDILVVMQKFFSSVATVTEKAHNVSEKVLSDLDSPIRPQLQIMQIESRQEGWFKKSYHPITKDAIKHIENGIGYKEKHKTLIRVQRFFDVWFKNLKNNIIQGCVKIIATKIEDPIYGRITEIYSLECDKISQKLGVLINVVHSCFRTKILFSLKEAPQSLHKEFPGHIITAIKKILSDDGLKYPRNNATFNNIFNYFPKQVANGFKEIIAHLKYEKIRSYKGFRELKEVLREKQPVFLLILEEIIKGLFIESNLREYFENDSTVVRDRVKLEKKLLAQGASQKMRKG